MINICPSSVSGSMQVAGLKSGSVFCGNRPTPVLGGREGTDGQMDGSIINHLGKSTILGSLRGFKWKGKPSPVV